MVKKMKTTYTLVHAFTVYQGSLFMFDQTDAVEKMKTEHKMMACLIKHLPHSLETIVRIS
jgi:hypothetical protein